MKKPGDNKCKDPPPVVLSPQEQDRERAKTIHKGTIVNTPSGRGVVVNTPGLSYSLHRIGCSVRLDKDPMRTVPFFCSEVVPLQDESETSNESND